MLYISGKKQFNHMNGVPVLTVKSAASGVRVQCSFVCDRSLSKRFLYTTFVKGSNFALLSNT